MASDLERLLAAADEPGPYILVGHSMAGLYVRLFTGRNPDKVRGVVLVDAATPEAQGPQMQHFLDAFGAVSRLAGWGASLGLLKPFEFAGDTIGPDRPRRRGESAAPSATAPHKPRRRRRGRPLGRHGRGGAQVRPL